MMPTVVKQTRDVHW